MTPWLTTPSALFSPWNPVTVSGIPESESETVTNPLLPFFAPKGKHKGGANRREAGGARGSQTTEKKVQTAMAGGHDAQQTQAERELAVLAKLEDVVRQFEEGGDAERFLGETVGQSRIPDSRCHRFCGNPLLSAPLTTCAVSHGRHWFFTILKKEQAQTHCQCAHASS